MDDFGLDRPELTGALLSLEFGTGGRIQQLWASDPNSPDDSEEFQFVCPPVPMGEEFAEDYFPGTILLGARTHPEDPWILSRNASATQAGDPDDPSVIAFQYEFGLIEELDVTGKYYEIPGRIPQIAWDVSVRNRSRRSVEIGELGFPLALNNVLEGLQRTDREVNLFRDRVHAHVFVGGATSHVFAQRINGEAPGLVIFPGGSTEWEFFNHVPASLTTPYRWEGIPVVYVHSRATIEREGWPEWFMGHSATILEPGETREYLMRFAPADRGATDNVQTLLELSGRPSLRLFPAAVVPYNVGIGLEVLGTTPARFWSDEDLELETEADEEGGYCFLKPPQPGVVRIGFEDTSGFKAETRLLFTAPIENLIQARASWILEHQICREAGPMHGAIVPADVETGKQLTHLEYFSTEFGFTSCLSDALFLAEKNTLYPVAAEIQVLDKHLEFVDRELRNPADGSVGSLRPTATGVAGAFGRPRTYMLQALMLESMSRIAGSFGLGGRRAEDYLRDAAETLLSMFRHTYVERRTVPPIPLAHQLPWLIRQLEGAGLAEAGVLRGLVAERWSRLSKLRLPYIPEGHWSGEGFEEVLLAARQEGCEELEKLTLDAWRACRSLAPCWWWYGSEKRWPGLDWPGPRMEDRGEICQGSTSVSAAAVFFASLDRDYLDLSDVDLRLAFGGMLGIWMLVREDGAAGMGFCPDAASKNFGMCPTSGDMGQGLYLYLRHAGTYVLPGQMNGVVTFGGQLDLESTDTDEAYVVTPWDGVGRRIAMRQIGFDVESEACRIQSLVVDSRKRNARISLQNPCDKDLVAHVVVRGLWGRRCKVADRTFTAADGAFNLDIPVAASDTVRIDIEVIG